MKKFILLFVLFFTTPVFSATHLDGNILVFDRLLVIDKYNQAHYYTDFRLRVNPDGTWFLISSGATTIPGIADAFYSLTDDYIAITDVTANGLHFGAFYLTLRPNGYSITRR